MRSITWVMMTIMAVGCGSDLEIHTKEEAPAVDELPECSEGLKVFLNPEKTYYLCEDGEWIATE